MGRRNETNRLKHKKKVDQKKKKNQDAASARKEKLKQIQKKFNQQDLKETHQ